MIAVAHDRSFVARFARTVWSLENARLVAYPGLAEYERAQQSRGAGWFRYNARRSGDGWSVIAGGAR